MTGAAPPILAVAPVSRGFGYVVLDAKGRPVAWGVKEIREEKNARSIFETDKLITLYAPAILVIEDHCAKGARRRERVCLLLDALAELAADRGLALARYGKAAVRIALGLPAEANKDDVAAAVAKRLPTLGPKLPRRRRIWEPERYAMPVFVAAGLALAHRSRAHAQ